jgi:hypothetical protein
LFHVEKGLSYIFIILLFTFIFEIIFFITYYMLYPVYEYHGHKKSYPNIYNILSNNNTLIILWRFYKNIYIKIQIITRSKYIFIYLNALFEVNLIANTNIIIELTLYCCILYICTFNIFAVIRKFLLIHSWRIFYCQYLSQHV